ncbi:MAG: IS1182 family transposase [Armatimonadetes bacterium]|nr:IS1182 family transposase [Armatimonadota bacterium]NIO98739.1 IS1182 family transposase [Armatimonadota bacterium]
MYHRREPKQETFFIPGSLSEYVPQDHILRRVDAVLDLSWLEGEVRGLYAEKTGRPCINPEQAVRLMLAAFFHGVVYDRALMREAQVNLAYRWFAGYELDRALPHHSSLTRIRQRWGEELFRRVFERVVAQCAQAGLVEGETLHVDASLIRADVSWESLVQQHITKVWEENDASDEEDPPRPKAGRPPTRKAGKVKKMSPTDPQASMATSCRRQQLEPSYKQHTAVDDKAGVIVDVEVTTGEANEGGELLKQVARAAGQTSRLPAAVTADAGYASSKNYQALEELEIAAVIPPTADKTPTRGVPASRFSYDAKHDLLRCPAGKILKPTSRARNGRFYRACSADCKRCPLRERCVPPTARARGVLITDGYCALLRARRCKRKGWPEEMHEAYRRHRWKVEGIHAEAKCRHGLRRAARRGLTNVRIQVYLTAVVMNLKRLARDAAARITHIVGDYCRRSRLCMASESP